MDRLHRRKENRCVFAGQGEEGAEALCCVLPTPAGSIEKDEMLLRGGGQSLVLTLASTACNSLLISVDYQPSTKLGQAVNTYEPGSPSEAFGRGVTGKR